MSRVICARLIPETLQKKPAYHATLSFAQLAVLLRFQNSPHQLIHLLASRHREANRTAAFQQLLHPDKIQPFRLLHSDVHSPVACTSGFFRLIAHWKQTVVSASPRIENNLPSSGSSRIGQFCNLPSATAPHYTP